MRRSKNGPEPSARGNFTPPPRVGSDELPGSEPVVTPEAGGGRLSPRNWRVRTRLNAILLIPVVLGLILAVVEVKGSIDTWQEAEDAAATARVVRGALDYADALSEERDLSAAPLLEGKGKNNPVVKQLRERSDKAAVEFDKVLEELPDTPSLQRRKDLFEQAKEMLPVLRERAYTKRLPGTSTEEGYVKVIHPLMDFANELTLDDGNVASYGRTAYAISLTKGAQSLQRSIGTHVLVKPDEDISARLSQRVTLSSYAYLERIAIEEYTGAGRVEDQERLESEMVEVKRKFAETAAQTPFHKNLTDTTEIIRMILVNDPGTPVGRATLKQLGITAETWQAVNDPKFEAYGKIESDLADAAVAGSQQVADDAKTAAFVAAGAVLLALIAAFVLAGLVARQMSRSMRDLRNAAFDVAEQRLPMLVDQLSRTDPGRVDTRVVPIPINTTDEIGEVARAFDQVHREAVRLAAEQALLRGNINAIFTNLSRRNQSLIEGQLTLITDLENNEADPDQLENLFKLDHLATRMRRNGENLLVLAGEEPGRRWDQPVPLVDILRAASSEVEQYERIELAGVPEAEIHGRAVTDLVHLLAELLENATTFSSPQTKVRVTATRLPDGRVMIEIHDKGIGLTAEDFADINHKLANPPTVDAAISQHMGLFVVGRLSDRHGIRVQLRPSGEQAGTTSLVMLPDNITHGGAAQNAPADEFTVSQIIPEQYQQASVEQAPLRTAAELGFDDSRYQQPGEEARELDPVGRQLLREERRAALEAQTHPQDFQAGQGYQDGQGYDEGQGYQDGGYDQQGYPEQQGYDEPYYGDQGYAESGQAQQQGGGQDGYQNYGEQPYQGDWQQQGYGNGYAEGYPADAESPQGADAGMSDGVGFGQGPATTDSGLPRRGGFGGGPGQGNGQDPAAAGDDWQSSNDGRWESASKLRKPKAGGVTSSGLPKRVPKANLVEGTAEATPQGGPQVSRNPDEVRGRLSNLRRGVQRGRTAGNETNGQADGNQFRGPDSTYNQER
ncbi:sensor histidine kinase [Streptomyces fragilis]|uniref:histidine kinase n=1 Tax=Streptomyces fragilis TaxID=67301 RepID=A0ABV2YH24_9ACTN|nr:nitrate- and nitrite sensing domain-containing protein [Streptomyces fragilis]